MNLRVYKLCMGILFNCFNQLCVNLCIVQMMGGPPHGYNSYQGPMDKYGDQYGGHQMRGNNRNMNNGPPPPTYQGGGGGYMVLLLSFVIRLNCKLIHHWILIWSS